MGFQVLWNEINGKKKKIAKLIQIFMSQDKKKKEMENLIQQIYKDEIEKVTPFTKLV